MIDITYDWLVIFFHLQDLLPVKTSDVNVLKKICDALDACKGFNTNGWLKKSIGQMYHVRTKLYVKEAVDVSMRLTPILSV